MSNHLEECYNNCRNIARSSNFYRGFSLLPEPKRRAFMAVYAFMRRSDDISDSEGRRQDKQTEFARWRDQLDLALQGKMENHPTLPALRDAIERYQIPHEYFLQLMEGTQADLTSNRYATFEDLRRYCYSVASVVGLISIRIFGYTGEGARERAVACGVAFQLTNILRDLKEDMERGRIYLPQEDLERFRYSPEDLRNGLRNDCYRALMTFEDRRTMDYYKEAWPLGGMIDRDSRLAFRAVYHSYLTILNRIRRRDYDVFSGRVGLRRVDKAFVLLKALF